MIARLHGVRELLAGFLPRLSVIFRTQLDCCAFSEVETTPPSRRVTFDPSGQAIAVARLDGRRHAVSDRLYPSATLDSPRAERPLKRLQDRHSCGTSMPWGLTPSLLGAIRFSGRAVEHAPPVTTADRSRCAANGVTRSPLSWSGILPTLRHCLRWGLMQSAGHTFAVSNLLKSLG